jgi:hypothetical protein
MTSDEREQITLPPRLIEPETQITIARLQRQCLWSWGQYNSFMLGWMTSGSVGRLVG